jgi:FLVCR family feline leukemia virus subgroup C receptor-related protein
MHPLFTFPAAYVIDSMGTRAGIMVGSILSIVGVSLRLLINQGFWLVLVGQVLAGMGRPFILNCQAKISANWFHASKRVSYTTS